MIKILSFKLNNETRQAELGWWRHKDVGRMTGVNKYSIFKSGEGCFIRRKFNGAKCGPIKTKKNVFNFSCSFLFWNIIRFCKRTSPEHWIRLTRSQRTRLVLYCKVPKIPPWTFQICRLLCCTKLFWAGHFQIWPTGLRFSWNFFHRHGS